jgi:hypothetical protein
LELPRHRPYRAQPRSEDSERGLRGWRALWQQRFDDFETLRRARNGFSQGCRNRAAYIYGVILRGNGRDDAAVRGAVTILGKECRPSLSGLEIQNAIEQSKESRGRLRDTTIAAFLKVTSEEGRFIPRWAQSRTLQEEVSPTDMNLTSTARIDFRTRNIVALVESLGRVPSTRQMAQLLQQRGIYTSHVQVSRDYTRLQLTSGSGGTFSVLFSGTDVTLVGRERGGREQAPTLTSPRIRLLPTLRRGPKPRE